ncbi:Uncharacterised protein [Candidatus Gugararchaeum adminiculabundum]|nr:Uncharacterised protein [Candidatus Gugararchaeum adminiculabundum]
MNMKRNKTILAAAGLLAVLIILAGCAGSGTDATK